MQKLIVLIIRAYQVLVSPFLGQNCRFYPTCSEYSKECFKVFSLPRALWYSFRRTCKCHPFCPGGFDPVPKINAGEK